MAASKALSKSDVGETFNQPSNSSKESCNGTRTEEQNCIALHNQNENMKHIIQLNKRKHEIDSTKRCATKWKISNEPMVISLQKELFFLLPSAIKSIYEFIA
eukprot:435632_1